MKKKVVSGEAAEKMNTLLEIIGEGFIYPAEAQKEQWAVSVLDLKTGAEGDLNGDVKDGLRECHEGVFNGDDL